MKTIKTIKTYVVAARDYSFGYYEIKRGYFNLGWNASSQRKLEENGVSHTRNNYYNEGGGVTFRVRAYSQKEAIRKVRKYIKEKNYPVFCGLEDGTDYVSLRLR